MWQDNEEYVDEEVCVVAVAVPRGCSHAKVSSSDARKGAATVFIAGVVARSSASSLVVGDVFSSRVVTEHAFVTKRNNHLLLY